MPWGVTGSIRGPKGDTGAQGPRGAQGPAGEAPAGPVGTDLSEQLSLFTAPMSGGQSYRHPTAQEGIDAVAGLRRLLDNGDASSKLGPLGFVVSDGYDALTKRPYTLAASLSPATDGRAWGFIVIDRSAPVRTVISCPHPVFDAASEQMALALWQRTPGAMLLIAGAHRDAASGAADPRDNAETLFHLVATTLLDLGLPHVQMHGFANTSAPGVDVVLSPAATAPGIVLSRIGDELDAAGLSTTRTWINAVSGLGGATNIQGLFAHSVGAAFVHVEASATVRTGDVSKRKAVIDALAGADVAGLVALGAPLASPVSGQYPVSTGSTNTTGTSRYAARSDHRHALAAHAASHAPGSADPLSGYEVTTAKDQPSGYAGLNGSGKLSGSVPLYAASSTIVPTSTAAAAGTSNTAARGDHVHPLGPHSHPLREATDYDNTTTPTDGQAILWVPGVGKWAPRAVEIPANRSTPTAKVPGGYVGADSGGNVPSALQYAASDTQWGVVRNQDIAKAGGQIGSLGDRQTFGDEVSPLPRLMCNGTTTGALNTLYYLACIAGFDDVATRVRLCTRSAAAGSGALNVAVFVGANPTALPRVATAVATAVASGLLDLALSTTITYSAGQWVVVALQMTGFTTIPSFAGANVPSAILNSGSYVMGAARGSTTSMPTSLNLTTQSGGTGQPPWWALT